MLSYGSACQGSLTRHPRFKDLPMLDKGRRIHAFVEYTIGSLADPMTNAQLEAKFRGMADSVLGAQR